jgi:hypothetical protein
MPNKETLSNKKITLLELGIELLTSKSLQRLLQVQCVILIILGVDQNVVDKDYYELV